MDAESFASSLSVGLGLDTEFEKMQRKSLIARDCRKAFEFPTIAQLVERPTVVAKSQLSGGPWFESGWSDLFYAMGSALP